MTSRARVAMLMVLAVLAAGFVYLHVLARRVAFQNPAQGEEGARTQLRQAALQSATGPTQTVTLYFPSEDESKLVAETRQMVWAANDPDRIRQILLALMEGSHEGHGSILPPSTDLRAVFLTSRGAAYLDFSSNFLGLISPGIGSETLTVYSIVDSLAVNIPTVKKVRILVQGQEVETLNGHVDLSEEFAPDVARGAPPP